MIISHEHKFIFLKTRKTGSTSTELFLFPHCGAEDIITPLTSTALTRSVGHHAQKHIRPAFALDPRPWINRFWQLEGARSIDYHDHIRAQAVRSYVGEEIWRSYYKFAFDRNIYDRQVSWFHYKTRKAADKKRWPDFKTFLQSSPKAVVDNFQIYSIGGELAVDFMGRYETLREDLGKVLQTLGLPGTGELPHAKGEFRPEGRPAYRDYYDSDTRALVESWYPGELKLFHDSF